MNFTITARENRARTGQIETGHGTFETPMFMPVGTVGSVKSLESREISAIGAKIVLSNAYHLYLRPGTEVLEHFGGLHKFMNWSGPMLVDSGGFQVFSLSEIRTISEEGVKFQSHIDGSYHLFTPEKVVEIQRSIGPDFVMPLDELVGWPADRETADNAAQRSWRWLERGIEHFKKTAPLYGHEQTLVPIIQGSFYPDLRRREAERYAALDWPMYAIGGLAVGEERPLTDEAIDICNSILPEDRPKYTMGVGFPWDLLNAISRGIDMFDCVVPTRNGRNATLFTFKGKLNMRNARFDKDERPVEEGCPCPCCSQYSRAYVHHLYRSGEILALKLGSAHNLAFYFRLLEQVREKIKAGEFTQWATDLSEQMQERAE